MVKWGRLFVTVWENLFPRKVYAAGRSFEKAKQFASTTHGKVLPLQMNAYEKQSVNFLEKAALVVMSLDQEKHDGSHVIGGFAPANSNWLELPFIVNHSPSHNKGIFSQL
ncbi:hypothetical protein [Paenibacillus sp. PL91]|uniref:hypothetical protein n=1 Tax=Paenibacillus sp. PL91 TaxID=2729538 RepID=UPI001658DAB0|nr:hypothetical protein [Paenibacillus sp. PL91]MBC9200622.1 hypothetical protein [Paenibacillus sp. PL91]